jgi:hypothetical protein
MTMIKIKNNKQGSLSFVIYNLGFIWKLVL